MVLQGQRQSRSRSRSRRSRSRSKSRSKTKTKTKTEKTDVRKILEDCPQCELNKARQNTAHGLFSALPAHAHELSDAWTFRGKAWLSQERPRPTSRYVVVIPLADREASSWLQPFRARVGPHRLHVLPAPSLAFGCRPEIPVRRPRFAGTGGGHCNHHDPRPQYTRQWHDRNILAFLEPLYAVAAR
jgi:hypothetical protein